MFGLKFFIQGDKMEKFGSAGEILEFAIKKETEAADFYTRLAEKMKNPNLAQTFRSFATEELKHKEKLILASKGAITFTPGAKIMDMKISDYLAESEPEEAMGYDKALRLAMLREKKAFMLYNDLADSSEGEIRDMFISLAQEEAKHKLKLEIEYDENILTDN